ncbi:MAG TPA: PEGA domain-containing protein [Kofleriaceae bacterium]|nr:PEGA domain-containing protein [Kofleriaceae bacterium]
MLPTQPAPITSEFGTQVLREERRRPSRLPLVIGAVVLAGGAAAGGVILGKNGLGGSDGPDRAAAPARAAATAPIAAADREQATPAPAAPAEPAAPAAPAASEPQVTPVVTAPADVLAATGFDIRVEPGATITLDGSVLGKAPLRVRNLQPGPHTLDIEAPPGYFSRRVELALAAGEAKDLRLSLDAIEEDTAPAATADAGADRPKSKTSRRARAELRRERKEKARQEKERKKEMRAARAAAARSAKKSTVVAEPLKDEPAARAKDEKMDAADAELEAAMAEITGKPVPRRSGSSAAAAAGASSLAASEPGAISGKGTLMLGSKPPCDIILDGKPTGLKTPQRAMELSAGTHSVTLVNPELGIEKKFKVKIAPGKTTRAIQDLTDKLD